MTTQIEIPTGSFPALADKQPILLVDDDPSMLQLLKKSLGLQGHYILSAQTGAEAISLCRQSNPALIILDISMPGLNGFEICEELKLDSSTSKIPVIFLSGSEVFADKLMGLKLGAVDFISKPVQVQELILRVNTQMKLRRAQDRLEKLYKKNEELLLNIMPQSIAERLREGELHIVDRIPEASILFCDLVGFTPMAAKMRAGQLVALLNAVFSEIDALIEKHGLEKIKTIGDAYMAAAGVPEPMPDHASRMVDFALELREELVRVERQWTIPIRFRIGIHSGEVVAGIIGTKRLAYDLWGDTVNTASRLESSCAPSQIHISEETLLLLEGKYNFTPRGRTDLRGKGVFDTYYINRKISGTNAHHSVWPGQGLSEIPGVRNV
ncbi:MAG: adenylate/guanylate cyclase domain-containing protein [Verrucomicrobiales bacterium]|nr:adenylate/guanylate cyclase domain-containing protein [Verrucomicrobiales bacterium]